MTTSAGNEEFNRGRAMTRFSIYTMQGLAFPRHGRSSRCSACPAGAAADGPGWIPPGAAADACPTLPPAAVRRYRSGGFTLIDLMIVVAIISILTAIVIPGYQEAMRKLRRAEARAALLQLAQDQERYFSQTGSYMPFDIKSTNAEAMKFKAFSGTTASSSAYELSGVACAGDSASNCLVLIAKPGTANVNANYTDPVCGSLTLSTTGIKATQPETAAGKCW